MEPDRPNDTSPGGDEPSQRDGAQSGAGERGAAPASSSQPGRAQHSPAQPNTARHGPTEPDHSTQPADTNHSAHTAKPAPVLAIALGVLSALLLGLAAAAAYVLTHLDEWIATAVVQKAAERGIIVGIGKLDWNLDGAVLTDTDVTLSGVPSTVVHLERLETDVRVDLSGVTIKRIEVKGAQATVLGSAALVALELGYWTAKYTSALDLPMRASGIGIIWRAEPTQAPWLDISGAEVTPKTDSGSLLAKQVVLAGQNLGTVGGEWSLGRSDFTIGLGEASLDAAPIQVNVVYTGEVRSLDAALAPTSLRRLESAFGVDLPDQEMAVETRVHLELDPKSFNTPATGWMKATLHGFIPPHPPELDGFVFGDKTEFETQLFVDEARAKIRLESAKVQAGKFVLMGQGVVTRSDDSARLLLELRGALSCTALAGAAIESRLGKLIGPWLRRAAERALQGSVTVTVKVDADSRHLEQMKMARLIGMGCGLKPLKLPGLEDFELPVLGSLPKLSDILPPLPSVLPSLPGTRPRQSQSKPGLTLPLPSWKSLNDDARDQDAAVPSNAPSQAPSAAPAASAPGRHNLRDFSAR